MPANIRNDAVSAAKNDLKNYTLTDRGYRNMKSMRPDSIKVSLCTGTCVSQKLSNKVNGQEVVRLNINGSGFQLAEGGVVEMKGLRLLSHELDHAFARVRVRTPYVEATAVRHSNTIMKQHSMNMKVPHHAAVQNHYGPALGSVPKGVALKEGWIGL